VLFGRVIVDGLGSAVAADRIPQDRERPEQQIDDAQAILAAIEGAATGSRPSAVPMAGFFSSTASPAASKWRSSDFW